MSRLLFVAAIALGATGPAIGGELHDAASAGDLAAVERLLVGGAKVDDRERNAETPLIVAALAGQYDVAKALLARDADVHARNAGGFTPLHAAAYSGSVPVVVLLLEKGAKLDDADNEAGVTPLLVAAEENHTPVVELLITRGADVSKPEVHGYTPLMRTFLKGHADVVQLLKRHGATCPPAGRAWWRGRLPAMRDHGKLTGGPIMQLVSELVRSSFATIAVAAAVFATSPAHAGGAVKPAILAASRSWATIRSRTSQRAGR